MKGREKSKKFGQNWGNSARICEIRDQFLRKWVVDAGSNFAKTGLIYPKTGWIFAKTGLEKALECPKKSRKFGENREKSG